MLTLYHSNDLTLLVSIAAHVLTHQHKSHPFKKMVILTQHKGMEKWLKIQLAQEMDVLANVDFLLPAQFLKQVYQKKTAKNQLDPFDRQAMLWTLMHILEQIDLNDPIYAPVSRYLSQSNDSNALETALNAQEHTTIHDLLHLRLARKISQLFDQYLLYRPQLILLWEQHQYAGDLGEHEYWQADLWRRLCAWIKARGQQPLHLAYYYSKFMQSTSDTHELRRYLVKSPESLLVIGISSLPIMLLQLFERLSIHFPVHLFFTNPSPLYWGDLQRDGGLSAYIRLLKQKMRVKAGWQHDTITYSSTTALFNDQLEEKLFAAKSEDWQAELGHPLLASMGKMGRDYLYFLTQLNAHEIEAFVEPEAVNLLSKIQHEIFHLRSIAETTAWTLQPDDHSIMIHNAYSQMREVETLYDQLLDFLSADPTLTLNDIIVMTPDINIYTPFIHAVFANAPEDRQLPYSIADNHLSQSDPITLAVLQLLRLSTGHFTVDEVAQLLRLPDIALHFDLTQRDVERAIEWITAAQIRWGRTPEHIGQWQSAIDTHNTWFWGMQRLLLGVCSAQSEHLFAGVLPYADTRDFGELTGKLVHLIDTLMKWCTHTEQPLTLLQTTPLISMMAEMFFQATADVVLKFQVLDSVWQTMMQHAQHSYDVERLFCLSHFAEEFERLLNKEVPSQSFLAGKINFCTLMPMRAIPFKVVCLLGMNQDIFPHVHVPDGFDLIALKPQKGDRHPAINDRYLFLEALLCARQYFYISYVGRSIVDDTVKLPSLLVDELLHYVIAITTPTSQVTAVSHQQQIHAHLYHYSPLTPFSAQLFDEKAPQSYQHEWIPIMPITYPESTFLAIEPATTVDFETILNFFKDPIQYFCQQRLGVKIKYEEHQKHDNDENFGDLKGLENYHFMSELIERALTVSSHQALVEYFSASGILPKFAYQALYWQEKIEAITPLVMRLKQEDQVQTVMQSWQLVLDQYLIHGYSRACNAHGYMYLWTAGELNFKRIISAFIEHLIQCILQPDFKGTFYLTLKGKSILSKKKEAVTALGYGEYFLSPMSVEKAKQILNTYLMVYTLGLNHPFLWLDRFEYDHIDNINKILDESIFSSPDFLQLSVNQRDEVSNFIMTIPNDHVFRKVHLSYLEDTFNLLNNPALHRLFTHIETEDYIIFLHHARTIIKPILDCIK